MNSFSALKTPANRKNRKFAEIFFSCDFSDITIASSRARALEHGTRQDFEHPINTGQQYLYVRNKLCITLHSI